MGADPASTLVGGEDPASDSREDFIRISEEDWELMEASRLLGNVPISSPEGAVGGMLPHPPLLASTPEQYEQEWPPLRRSSRSTRGQLPQWIRDNYKY